MAHSILGSKACLSSEWTALTKLRPITLVDPWDDDTEYESTWEPPRNIKDKAPIALWRQRKMQKPYRMERAFDPVKFEERRRKGGKFGQG